MVVNDRHASEETRNLRRNFEVRVKAHLKRAKYEKLEVNNLTFPDLPYYQSLKEENYSIRNVIQKTPS